MIDNVKLTVSVGGYTHCDSRWNQDRGTVKFAEAFSFLLPVSGEAFYETVEGEFRVAPGRVYYLPGHHIIRQWCDREMGVYWINFLSESYYLHHRLMNIKGVRGLLLADMPTVDPVFRQFMELFENPATDLFKMRPDPPAALVLKIEGTLMYLTGCLLESTNDEFDWGDFIGLERLKPAIDFMDKHYLRNPSLSEIAREIHLAPNYFHRSFKRETGLTPFKYMENRRLDLARKYLFDRRLNITEVAREAGYSGLDYFSRAFRRRFGLSPSRLRQAS